MKRLLLALAVAGFSKAASADVPAWVCNLKFSGTIKGIQVIVGKTTGKGAGELNCVNPAGNVVDIPVKVGLKAHPIALEVTVGKFNFTGESLNFSLFNHNPEDILGEYEMINSEVSVGVGGGVVTMAKLHDKGLQLGVTLGFAKGLGFHLGIEDFEILRAE